MPAGARVEGQGVQVGFALQQIRRPRAARQSAYVRRRSRSAPTRAPATSPTTEPMVPGNHQRLGDIGERGLNLLRQGLPES